MDLRILLVWLLVLWRLCPSERRWTAHASTVPSPPPPATLLKDYQQRLAWHRERAAYYRAINWDLQRIPYHEGEAEAMEAKIRALQAPRDAPPSVRYVVRETVICLGLLSIPVVLALAYTFLRPHS